MDKYPRAFQVMRSAIALALGIAVVVLAVLRAADIGTLVILLGIGVFILGVDNLVRK